MTTIIPRWEWRTFGSHFGAAEAAFAALSPHQSHESDELYLSTAGGAIVKVRDDLLDVKVLQEVDADGLEQWIPVLKAGFPLQVRDVAAVFEALRITPPPLDRDAYTFDQFVNELAGPDGEIRPVTVHKERVRYMVDGCMAEVTEVTVEGRATRTIAVESEDAAAVIAAVRSLGLDGHVNTSYARGLAATIDGGPARYAVIDVGTNSVKFHIGERAERGTWRSVVDRAELTRLGEGLEQNGAITSEALDRTASAIAAMVDEAKHNDVLAIAAVGTAGLRIAANRDDVIEAIKERAGITVQVIPGEEEGRLAYLAVKAGLGLAAGSLVVFDTGGGSTQFTFGRGEHVDDRFSVNVGAVSYTERFGLAGVVSLAVLRETLAAISHDLSVIDDRPVPDALVAMGGAVTNITAVKHALTTYDPDIVQGTVLDRSELDRQIELYRSQDVATRRVIVGLQPKRADVILAGACIVLTVMDKMGQETLTVSDRGLRHGLLAERFGDPLPQ